jgi:hypothetical protein
MSPWPEIRFAIRRLTSGPLSSNLSMEAKHTIFVQKSAKNNLNFGLNSMRVSRESQGGYWIGKLAKSIG